MVKHGSQLKYNVVEREREKRTKTRKKTKLQLITFIENIFVPIIFFWLSCGSKLKDLMFAFNVLRASCQTHFGMKNPFARIMEGGQLLPFSCDAHEMFACIFVFPCTTSSTKVFQVATTKSVLIQSFL